MSEHKSVVEEYSDSLFSYAILLLAEKEGKKLAEDAQNLEAIKPSEASQRRISRAIGYAQRRSRMIKAGKMARKVANRAVVIVAVILLIGLTLTISVRAIRERVVELLINFESGHAAIELETSNPFGNATESEQYEELKGLYAPTYVPEGYVLASASADEVLYIKAGDESQYILLSIYTEDASASLDTENADKVEEIYINSSKGLLVDKEGVIRMVWDFESHYFVFFTTESEEKAIKIAESVAFQK